MFEKLQAELVSYVMGGAKGGIKTLTLFNTQSGMQKFNNVIGVKHQAGDYGDLLIIEYKSEPNGNICKATFKDSGVVGVTYEL